MIAGYKYDVFGSVRSSTGSGWSEYRFTGQQDDAILGMTYLRARYYDPGLGRFTQRDPIVPNVHDSQALNRYAYGLSNLIRYIDPLGLDGIDILKGWGEADNECFSSAGGALGGNVVNIKCFGLGCVTVVYRVIEFCGIPVVTATVSPMSPPKGGQAGDGGSRESLKDLMLRSKMKASEAIAKFKQGRILREFPAEFLDKTLEEIQRANQRGDPGASTALKLLIKGEYDK